LDRIFPVFVVDLFVRFLEKARPIQRSGHLELGSVRGGELLTYSLLGRIPQRKEGVAELLAFDPTDAAIRYVNVESRVRTPCPRVGQHEDAQG
jgi:hypothetical protein